MPEGTVCALSPHFQLLHNQVIWQQLVDYGHESYKIYYPHELNPIHMTNGTTTFLDLSAVTLTGLVARSLRCSYPFNITKY